MSFPAGSLRYSSNPRTVAGFTVYRQMDRKRGHRFFKANWMGNPSR